MAKSAYVLEVTDDTFDRDVLIRSQERPVVVDFWAPWCGPCRALTPILEKLIDERGGEVYLAKVNIDECQELAMRYYVDAIPAVKAFRDGKVVLEFMGLLPEPQLRGFLDQIVPSAADRLYGEARALEATNPGEAERLYRQAVAEDQNHMGAALGLARVLVAGGKDEEASHILVNIAATGEEGEEAERLRALIELRELAKGADEKALRKQIQSKPDDAEAHYRLGCVLAATGRFEEALATLLAAAERDRKLATEQVRPVMVKVFHQVGVRSELADSYRDKLMRLLY